MQGCSRRCTASHACRSWLRKLGLTEDRLSDVVGASGNYVDLDDTGPNGDMEPMRDRLPDNRTNRPLSSELKAVLHDSLARIDMRIRTVAMRPRSTLSNSPWVCPASAADRSGKQQLPSSR